MVDVSKIEEKVEKARSAAVEIGVTIGNITISTPNDIDQMSLRLSRGGPMVPPHCRGENGVGVIHGLIVQALEWRMPIMAVLNKSYVVNNKGVERIAYESQLIHAVIERNAPLKSRLRYEIGHLVDGIWEKGGAADDERRCKVFGTFHGEISPHEYISQTLGKLRDARGRNDSGTLKGSPLWDHDPDVQLFYSASRQWARNYAPDVILGAYTPEDPQYEMRDVTPAEPPVVARLKAAEQRKAGFDIDRIQREAGRTTIIEGEVNPAEKNDAKKTETARGDEAGVRDSGGSADDRSRRG